MRIEINGEPRDVLASTTIAALLDNLGLGDKPVAVEVNQLIVPRAEHAAHALREGDRLELVQFVGGG
jgi:sulfur carrier protein